VVATVSPSLVRWDCHCRSIVWPDNLIAAHRQGSDQRLQASTRNRGPRP